MKNQFFVAGIFAFASTTTAANPTVAFYAGAQHWNQNYEGFVRDLDTATGNTRVDLQSDLGLDDESGNVIYLAFEHPVPYLPNIKLQQTELEINGNSQGVDFDFDNQNFSTSIISEIDLSHTDATFYWELLDNYVSVDVGLTARWFDGDIKIRETGSNSSANEKLDAVVPLLYSGVRVDLPLNGLYASVSGNFLGTGDNSFLDYQATVGYESAFRFGVEAGFRRLDLDLDDVDNVEADVTVDGAFIGLFFQL